MNNPDTALLAVSTMQRDGLTTTDRNARMLFDTIISACAPTAAELVEPEFQEWIENPYRDGSSDHDCLMTYEPGENYPYSATSLNMSGNRGSNRCTGYGQTLAEAVQEMEERLDEFARGA